MSQQNKEVKRHATVLPSAPDPINERNPGESMAEYKERRREVNRILRNRTRKGFLVYCAAEIVDINEARRPLESGSSGSEGPGEKLPPMMVRRTHQPFVGLTRYLQVL